MSARRALLAPLAGAVIAALAALHAPPAGAAPTVWARARDPGIDEREALITQADALLERYGRLLQSPLHERVEEIGPLWLREARSLYERAGAARARDPALRLKYASLLEDLADYAGAAEQLASLLRADPPAPYAAEAWRDLAVCYARLGRHRDEIKAYGEALAIEPHSGPRSILLANRAEAYMALGDITSAVDGYRAALAALSTREMFRFGVTALWGLSVALDRSGDLDGAIEHIGLARSYDRMDASIHGRGWFYVPEYDEAWYAALGHWAAARGAQIPAARAESYLNAIRAWEDYILRAPANDHWIELARARLAQCEKEAARAQRRGAGKQRP